MNQESSADIFSPGRAPVISLLFLTRGDVNLPEIWTQFSAEMSEPRIFSHPKYPEVAERGFLKGTAIAELIPTKWATISGPRAMLLLLQEAMRDETTTHFAFLSESCIPVKSYQQIVAMLDSDPRSMIAMAGPEAMGPFHLDRWKGASGIDRTHWRVHPNWCILDRDTASCILSEDLTSRFERVWAPDEHYFGTVLAMHGYPEGKMNRVRTTWDNWTRGTPAYFDQVEEEVIEELVNFPGFFARKFRSSSDITFSRIFRTVP